VNRSRGGSLVALERPNWGLSPCRGLSPLACLGKLRGNPRLATFSLQRPQRGMRKVRESAMTRPTHPQNAERPERWIPRILAQDAEAIDAWYRQEHPTVYRLCFGFLAQDAEAEDVAQDAMLQLLDKLDTFDAARSYGSWRDTLVLNRCRDRRRRNEARGRMQERSVEARAGGTVSDPHAELEAGETQAILREALQQLTPREREVFVFVDLEGLDSTATARRLSITASSVRSLLTLARRRLRGILEVRLPGLGSEGGRRG